jgi:hypothetical protein
MDTQLENRLEQFVKRLILVRGVPLLIVFVTSIVMRLLLAPADTIPLKVQTLQLAPASDLSVN